MRLLLISNRLPVTIKREQDSFTYEHSVGGLVTGISDYLEHSAKKTQAAATTINNYLWIGWPGISVDAKSHKIVQKELSEKFNSFPIFLPEKQTEKFYYGFCNKTVWPLFHYFPTLTVYDDIYWNSYKSVNESYYNAVTDIIQDDDVIWIHDYHLMLLPALIRKKHPNVKIGFFLHIPFPAFEVFRLMPKTWREKILQGLLGADLVGFHTPEYTQYFLHCVQRILGLEHNLGKIVVDGQIIKADTFPMGINFDKFHDADNLPIVSTEIEKLQKTISGFKVILSIDRLDYTKGILNRLYGYERFLESNSEWLKKVVLILIVVPSRTGIDHYQQIKKQVDEHVGKINGKFGNVNWTPVLYQYKFFEFPYLAALYKISDIALVTPLRDGMNLIAKEYIASRKDKTGVLILSEMAGASKELGEALIINPNSIEAIADSLKNALLIKTEDQIQATQTMQDRLRNYNVIQWAEDFLYELQRISHEKMKIKSRIMSDATKEELIKSFVAAKQKIIFLDYDGTLSPLTRHPDLAKPSTECLNLLTELAKIPAINLVLISGRSKNTLQDWFQIKNLNYIAEHGAWIKLVNAEWETIKPLTNNWKQQIIPILQIYANRVPGTFIENKEYSVCWHYRNADPEFAAIRTKELNDDLVSLTANSDLQVMQGNKVIEVKNAGISKGMAASSLFSKNEYDFIMAVGDDLTDEDLFQILPQNSFSIKVGAGRSHAKYNLANSGEVIDLLKKIIGAT